ncbi:CBS domain-containing protein [Devosia sp.]|uniref:CBS domain-containing protein n=1 Tax=Devosia sp. TaxID=1871048 RepID=UPI003A952127
MIVEHILQTKGGTVQTVAADAPVSEAVRLLKTHRIGAVVVTDAIGRVSGILSERDIVRQLDGNPAELLATPVRDSMTAKVITAVPSDTVEDMMEKMTAHRIRHLPVVDAGKLVGIISIGDVVKLKIEQAEAEARALKDYIAS